MNRKFTWVLSCIVGLECALAVYVGIKVYKKLQSERSEPPSVSFIHKQHNLPSPVSPLRFYYEPVINHTETDISPWLKKKVTWTYNSDTLNDRYNYSVQKPADTFRIVALGDSFTFGDHVNTSDAWPERLEDFLNATKPCKKYSRYEVLNLGLRGIDIQNMTERFRLRGAKYTPDLVIWLLISRDLSQVRELMEERVNEIYAKEKRDGTLDLLYPWGRPSKHAAEELHKKYTHEQIAGMQDGFFTDFLDMYSGNVLLAPIGDIEETYNLQIKRWTRLRTNIFYGDGLPSIWRDPVKLRVVDGHPSELGHMRIAVRFLEILRDSTQLFCQ